jgi:integrase
LPELSEWRNMVKSFLGSLLTMAVHIGIREMKPGVWRLRSARLHQRERYRTVYGTRAEAEAAAATWRAELEQYGPPPISQSASLASVIRGQLAVANLAPGTLAYYQRIIRLYIDPAPPVTAEERAAWGGASYRFAVGRKPIGRVTAQDGADFQAHLIERFAGSGNSGARSIAEAMRLCSKALTYAVRLRTIAVNPWKELERVKPREANVRVPKGRRELTAVQHAATGRTGLLLRLALASGARRGELLALTWARVDLETGAIDIAGTLYQAPDGAYSVRPPKSRAGRRVVSLPAAMVTELRSARAAAAEQALATGARLADVPVLPGDDGGWWSPMVASQAARRALHHAGLPTSLHALRHSNASVLLSERISPEAVRRRLGHGAVATTLKYYAHAMVSDEPAAAAAIGEAMRIGKPQ